LADDAVAFPLSSRSFSPSLDEPDASPLFRLGIVERWRFPLRLWELFFFQAPENLMVLVGFWDPFGLSLSLEEIVRGRLGFFFGTGFTRPQ